MNYVGIDIHKRYSVLVAVDGIGKLGQSSLLIFIFRGGLCDLSVLDDSHWLRVDGTACKRGFSSESRVGFACVTCSDPGTSHSDVATVLVKERVDPVSARDRRDVRAQRLRNEPKI
jgi:hypothetical protein